MEEEKIKVTCQGKIYDVIKKGKSYSLKLPSKGTRDVNITGTAKGSLRYMESDGDKADSFLWIKYRKDGHMEYSDHTMSDSKISEDVYTPNNYIMGTIDEPARNLYNIAKQIEGYEKIGVSPIEVLELRYKMMGMALKMLGYESVSQVLKGEPNPDISVVDLNKTIQFIEKYPAFAQYVTKGEYARLAMVDVTVPENFDKEKFKEEFVSAKKMLAEEEQSHTSRAEFFANIRHPMIKPDFALGMQDKVSSSSWESYSEVVKKLGKLILSYNADLLAPAEKMQIIQATSLDKMEMEHSAFLITQVPEMDEALAAESYFFIDEVEDLERKVEDDLKDERTRNSNPGKLMKQFVDDLKAEVDDRKNGIERRDFYRNVYPYDKKRRREFPKDRDDEDPIFGD